MFNCVCVCVCVCVCEVWTGKKYADKIVTVMTFILFYYAAMQREFWFV